MQLQFDIRCPPKDLWPWLTEPERMKQWMKGLESVETLTPGPTRVGSVARMTIREGGRSATYDSKVVGYEPLRRLAIELSSPKWKGMEMTCEYRLEDVGGATRMTYDFACKTTRLLFKILKVVAAPFGFLAKMQARSFMKTLKALAESGGARVTAA